MKRLEFRNYDGDVLKNMPRPLTDMLVMTEVGGGRVILEFEDIEDLYARRIFNPMVKTYLRMAWRAFKAHRKLRKKYKGAKIDARYTTLSELENEAR